MHPAHDRRVRPATDALSHRISARIAVAEFETQIPSHAWNDTTSQVEMSPLSHRPGPEIRPSCRLNSSEPSPAEAGQFAPEPREARPHWAPRPDGAVRVQHQLGFRETRCGRTPGVRLSHARHRIADRGRGSLRAQSCMCTNAPSVRSRRPRKDPASYWKNSGCGDPQPTFTSFDRPDLIGGDAHSHRSLPVSLLGISSAGIRIV